jgi:hypothetical protein
MLINIVIRCIPQETKAISFTDGFEVCDRVADNEKEKGEYQGHRNDLYRDRAQFLVVKQAI